jgi:WD40 repeat protein
MQIKKWWSLLVGVLILSAASAGAQSVPELVNEWDAGGPIDGILLEPDGSLLIVVQQTPQRYSASGESLGQSVDMGDLGALLGGEGEYALSVNRAAYITIVASDSDAQASSFLLPGGNLIVHTEAVSPQLVRAGSPVDEQPSSIQSMLGLEPEPESPPAVDLLATGRDGSTFWLTNSSTIVRMGQDGAVSGEVSLASFIGEENAAIGDVLPGPDGSLFVHIEGQQGVVRIFPASTNSGGATLGFPDVCVTPLETTLVAVPYPVPMPDSDDAQSDSDSAVKPVNTPEPGVVQGVVGEPSVTSPRASQSRVELLAAAPNGDLFVTTGFDTYYVGRLNADSSAYEFFLVDPGLIPASDTPVAATFGHDGTLFVNQGRSNSVMHLDAHGVSLDTITVGDPSQPESVVGLVLDASGNLVVASQRGTVRVYAY